MLLLAVTALVPACWAGRPEELPAPATPAEPPAEATADTARYEVLLQGNHAGTLVLWTTEGATGSRFAFNDRGRGPDLRARYRTGPDRAPVAVEIDGVDYYKNEVEERFTWGDGMARWRNPGERDSTRIGETAFYIPSSSDPSLMSAIVLAAERAPSGCIALLPAGEACAAPRDTVTIAVGEDRKQVVLHALSGVGFTPEHVWLEPDGRYFATTSGWLAVVPEGWEPVVEQLEEREAAAVDAWLGELADSLSEQPDGPVAITGARLFDPVSGRLRPASTVVFEGSRISAVGPDGSIQVPAGARRIEADGRVLLPGLFDMHVHLSPVDGILHLAAGVTSVRDLANDTDRLQEMRESFARGEAIGPRVTMGGILDGPGPFAGPTRALVSTDEGVREWVTRYADLGYAQVKVYSSVDTALIPTIIAAAHERGLRVSGHIPVHMRAEQAVRAGFDEIQHANMLFLNFRSDTLDTRTPVRFSEVGLHGAALDPASDSVRAFIDLLLEHDVVVDPTLAVFEGLLTARPGEVDPAFVAVADRLPPQVRRSYLGGGFASGDAERERYTASFRRMLDLVAALHGAGVTIVPGTDALAGFALHRELELYQAAGIDPVDVLRIATLTSARVADREAELGSIEPGKLADMVLLAGDPTRDVSAVRDPVLVIKDGTVYSPAALYRAIGVQPRDRASPEP